MKQYVLVMIGLLCFAALSAQRSTLSPLRVGDRINTVMLQQYLDRSLSLTPMKPLAGRSLLIDFWATWCSSCIKEFPHTNELLNKYADRLSIVAVSYEDKKKVSEFKRINKIAASVNFPLIAADTIFQKLFPHRSIPHYVWIDADGFVKAITAPRELTEQHVQNFLNGIPQKLETKIDILDFDRNSPLLENGNGGNAKQFLFRSTLTPYLPGGGTQAGLMQDSLHKRVFFTNHYILRLYQQTLAYAFQKRLVVQVADTNRFTLGETDPAWLRENAFSYEISVPAATSMEIIKEFMREDLDRYLGYTTAIEKRPVMMWVLSADSLAAAKVLTRGGKPIRQFYGTGIKYLVNQTLDKLLVAMNSGYGLIKNDESEEVIDETGINTAVDLELEVADIVDREAVARSLMSYGIKLTREKRMIDVLVIRDKIKPLK